MDDYFLINSKRNKAFGVKSNSLNDNEIIGMNNDKIYQDSILIKNDCKEIEKEIKKIEDNILISSQKQKKGVESLLLNESEGEKVHNKVKNYSLKL